MKRFLPILLILLAGSVSAQQLEYWHAYEGDNGIRDTLFDSSGNKYVLGCYEGSIDLDATIGTHNIAASDPSFFVARYDANGDLAWARDWRTTSGGANDHVTGEALAMDAAGNLYVAGSFQGSLDIDPGSGVDLRIAMDTSSTVGADNAFAITLDANGDLTWASTFRAESASAMSLVPDGNGGVHLAGWFDGEMDLDPGTNDALAQSASSNDTNTFIVSLDGNGDYAWHVTWNSPNTDRVTAIDTDSAGDIYVVGSFENYVQFDPDGQATPAVVNGDRDGVIVKYDTSGKLQWHRQLGKAAQDTHCTALMIDPNDVLWVGGDFEGQTDFDPGAGTANLTSIGTVDAFLLHLDTSGAYQWAGHFGGLRNDRLHAIAHDGNDIWVTGRFASLNIDLDPGTGSALHDDDDGNGYLVRLDDAGNLKEAYTYGGLDLYQPSGGDFEARTTTPALDARSGEVLMGGTFENSAGFFGGSFAFYNSFGSWFIHWHSGQTGIGQPLEIVTGTIPTSHAGDPATVTISGSGGSNSAYNWTLLTGSLPPDVVGLPSISTPDLILSGTPRYSGQFTFKVRLDDAWGNFTTKEFTWIVSGNGGSQSPPGDTASPGHDSAGCASVDDGTIGVLLLLLLMLGAATRRRAGTSRS